MNVATKNERATELRTESREARHWIERQLRWERTLGSLRSQRTELRSEARAA